MSVRGSHQSAECRQLLKQLCDYIDGELQPVLCAELERHLARCTDCRVLVDTTRKMLTLYRRYGQVELPAGAEERLWQALIQAGCLAPSDEG